jgi:KaiC/GvpD/RAD55 family RecA-like ATPase
MTGNRVPTYVKHLDERMEGGIPENYIVLVCGHTGTMKSTFSYSMIYKGAKLEGKKALYLTLEQSRESLLDHMTKLGMPLEGMDELSVVDLSRIRKDSMMEEAKKKKIDWLHSILTALRSFKERFGSEVLVLDSLAALYALAEFKNPRAELFHFFEQLRDINVTTFLISEMPTDREVFGLYGVEDFLSDGIIHLHVVRQENQANLYVNINKMRKTKHDRGFFPLIFGDDEFEIVVN